MSRSKGSYQPAAKGAGITRLSHSRVKGMLDHCAYQIALEKIVGLEQPNHPRAAVGISHHYAIEVHEQNRVLSRTTNGAKGNPRGLPLAAMQEAAMDELDKQDVNWREHDYDESVEQLWVGLNHWYNGVIPEGQPGAGGSLRDRVMQWRPIAIESFWTIWMPEATYLPVAGSPDGIYRDTESDELVVVDQKNTTRFGKYPLTGKGLRDQASMYVKAAMTSPRLPAMPDERARFEYHISRCVEGKTSRFQELRIVGIDVDDVDLDYVSDRIGKAGDRVETSTFPKNPDSWLCNPTWCSFHQDAGGPCDPHGPAEFDLAALASQG